MFDVSPEAAIYGDMVYFGTLDSKLVALDRKTGKVVWSKKVDNYQAGSSITSAPIIVHGHVIVTPAGGEFGVVGKVAAYDAKTGEEVWSRPFVEGWMGTFHGKESTMTGKRGATWPGICGRPVDRRLGTAARTIRYQPASLRHRQPFAVEFSQSSWRQFVFGLYSRRMPIAARSNGITKIRHMMAGTTI